MSKKNRISDQQLLFDADEIGRITPGDLWEEREEPVTCLGRKFTNEEARRKFFREELRKKLPELRKIEGFPIGTDDDIINLSDPPYYTACPNPWINDFITQWEAEKKQLELEGKRKADFEVKEPYASDVSEGKNNPIYNAHSYHTKVPHPAIMRYILHYTQPGDIVLDGFAGTGMTGVACRLASSPDNATKMVFEEEQRKLGYDNIRWGERHSILSDLSSVASFIASGYNEYISATKFKQISNEILDEVEKEFGWMYETHCPDGTVGKINYVVWSDVLTCPACGNEFVYWKQARDAKTGERHCEYRCPYCDALHNVRTVKRSTKTVYDYGLNVTKDEAVSVPVFIACSNDKGKRFEKIPDTIDEELIKKIETLHPAFWFPTEKMMGIGEKWGQMWRPYHVGMTNVHHFFTRRNLIVLSAIREKVVQRGFYQALLIITSIAQSLCSKLVRYNNGKRGNGILSLTLYVGSLIAEANVIKAARGKVDDIYKALLLLNSTNKTSNISSVGSTTQLPIEDNSVDYIFTDPPFGANIMYSELNFITESWLRVVTNNKEEAIENPALKKDLQNYQSLMAKSFKEYYRILKPRKWLTIEFSNTAASVWNAIQQAVNNAGFVVAEVSALDKQQGSFKAVTTTTAVKQDLVITCYKPSDELSSQFDVQMDRKDVVWDFIQEHLEHLAVHIEKGSKTTTVIERSPKILYDRLISYYVQHGLPVPMDAPEFQAGLYERFVERDGMFFTATQAAEYEEKRKHTDGLAPMGIIVSDEANGIEWLKNQLRESPKTYQQIQPEWMQAINGSRKGDILPELKVLLEENFIEMEDGRWRLPNIQDDVDKNLLRTKALLREFNLYKEQALKPKAKLREVRVEALRAGFKLKRSSCGLWAI